MPSAVHYTKPKRLGVNVFVVRNAVWHWKNPALVKLNLANHKTDGLFNPDDEISTRKTY